MVRFIHAADLHLDSPLRGLSKYQGAPEDAIRLAARRALENMVSLAIRERVDFVVIAGDVYDGDWEDVSTGLFLVAQMGRLNEHRIPVFLISGNHDAENRMTTTLPHPPNVTVFPTDQPKTEMLEHLRVAIHGQGYRIPAVKENLATNYPPPKSGYVNIGILHTGLTGREGHENYAPCNVNELVARGYDYWALGHIHQRESVNGDQWPRIEFPGNIQGRHIRETGEKGCLLVSLDASRRQAEVQFCPLDVFRWDLLEVDCSEISELTDIPELARDRIDQVLEAAGGRGCAVRLRLTGSCALHDSLVANQERIRNEIIAVALTMGSAPPWVEKVQIHTEPPGNAMAAPSLSDDALKEIAQVIQDLSADETLLRSWFDQAGIRTLLGNIPPHLSDEIDTLRRKTSSLVQQMLPEAQAFLSGFAPQKKK